MERVKRVKKERLERIKFALLVIAFVIVSILTHTKDANAAKNKEEAIKNIRKITMKAPEGTIIRFSSEGGDLLKQLSKNSFKKFGLSLSPNKRLCRNTKENLSKTIKQVETELELSYMISTLKKEGRPRLSSVQRDTLKKVPFCQPYLADLKVIANLLDGYKLINIEYL